MAVAAAIPAVVVPELSEGHRDFAENQRGVTYEEILMPYLMGATEIDIVDPYVRTFHQARNLMELLELIVVEASG